MAALVAIYSKEKKIGGLKWQQLKMAAKMACAKSAGKESRVQ